MTNPEETLTAFLKVLETKPDLFQTSDVQIALDQLNQSLTQSPDAPISNISNWIKDWCKQYPTIRDEVRAATRKVKAQNNIPTQENRQILTNLPVHPIADTLQDRLPKIGHSNQSEAVGKDKS
ncbi:hypothetical protein NG796_22985 [Laspinema sp. A4]|uniref:hypothetical protein n=1 Tax=Laspinema sp. D2d TaxID=2953686 RepID=UPI0021BACC77|nr:hypothetical protein [Laspinema sp. D2d]MCT7986142.1 hypothetical protein [Laspinema sp. D2d]